MLRTQSLAVPVASHQRLELADQRSVGAESEVGIHPVLDARKPQLFQMRALDHRERLLEVGQRRSAPQRKGFAQLRRGTCGVAASKHRPAVLAEAAEPHDVDRRWVELDRVTGRPRQQDLRRKQLAQLGNVDVHHLHGRIRHLIAPKVLHETLDAHRVVDVKQQSREQRALLAPAERNDGGAVVSLERSEEPELHRCRQRYSAPRAAARGRMASRARRRSAVPLPSSRQVDAVTVSTASAAIGYPAETGHCVRGRSKLVRSERLQRCVRDDRSRTKRTSPDAASMRDHGQVKTSVRRAITSDAEALADLYLRALKAARAYIPTVHTDDEVRWFIVERVIPRMETWVAADSDGELVGMLALDGALVEQLYVEPTLTRRGIGAELLELAKRERPAGLRLWTFEANLGARRFYERHDFSVRDRTDGDNEQGVPDVLYVWDGDGR